MSQPVYTTSNGAPVGEPYAAQRIGTTGPLLLQGRYRFRGHFIYLITVSPDFHHIDLLAHFDRERIPERVVRSLYRQPILVRSSS